MSRRIKCTCGAAEANAGVEIERHLTAARSRAKRDDKIRRQAIEAVARWIADRFKARTGVYWARKILAAFAC